jgi:alkylation response protein AidB-like acyl-CoA dehydrogenase
MHPLPPITAHYANFAARHVAPQAAENDASAIFPHAAWQALADEGLWDLLREPAEAAACWRWVAALEGLASEAQDAGFLLAVIAQAALIRAVHAHGSPALKTQVLPSLLKGELSATAIAEPQSGTDVPGLLTHAEATPDGRAYRLTGEKFNIALAGEARWALVVGRIPALAPRDITVFLHTTGGAGWQSGPADDKLGNRSLPTGPIRLDGWQVPVTAILGQPGEGLKVLATIGGFARACYGLAAAHLPAPLLRETLAWTRTRMSGGRALATLPQVHARLTDVRMGMESSHWSAMGAFTRLFEGNPDALLSCSAAKVAAVEALSHSSRQLLAVWGSLGYQRGPVERLLRDAEGWRMVGGTEELHRGLIWSRMQ